MPKNCLKCSKAVLELPSKVGPGFVKQGSYSWHSACFVCTKCNKALINSKFVITDDSALLCEGCDTVPNSPASGSLICKGCSKSIADKTYTNAYGFNYHKKCLNCGVCKKALNTGDGFYDEDFGYALHLTCLK